MERLRTTIHLDRLGSADSERNPELYGYVDDVAGTAIYRSFTQSRGDFIIDMPRDQRFRAGYDPSTMGTKADVIIPGHGVCKVEIGDGGVKFIREEKPPRFGVTSADHIHSLELHFDEIEDEELLSDLYDVVGAGLRKLTMEMYWSEEYPRISLYGVALFCLNLEELKLKGFNVELMDMEEEEWGLKKLVIEEFTEGGGLLKTLDDPKCQDVAGVG
ncbi:hypothetical protein PI124_g7424 [Phytophthora idaei]|nr:hypothetical protein PI125_g10918 [Phytophthora idaei]KAG3144804.1 hypothetical protein PI126_g13999 [Phytophthora idaei]KAG3247895.1 hypothetical protein PI124_g7424 [Phytophthora idaei]